MTLNLPNEKVQVVIECHHCQLSCSRPTGEIVAQSRPQYLTSGELLCLPLTTVTRSQKPLLTF